jgi:di/tricarboxylate transporter
VSADAWFTLVVVIVTMVLLVSERVQPSVVMVGAVVVLLVGDVITSAQAFAGFSNEAPIIVAALYVLAGATETTGAMQGLTDRALGTRASDPTVSRERRDLARVVVPGALGSAFIANTPLVSMVAPRIVSWCRRTSRSPSRFLMPFSYAAVFGGVITVVGTSTNVTVSGLLEQAGRPQLEVFEITPVGLPVAIVGVIALVLLTPLLLPRRQSPGETDVGGERAYTLEMLVAGGSSLVGKSVANAGLRNLEGVYLIEIERGGDRFAPVAPDEVLRGDDRLIFAGNITRVLDLHRIPGLVSAEHRHFSVASGGTDTETFEVVVAEGSPLVGSTIKEVDFRARYGAAVMAVHRADERLASRLGDVRLRPGDLLLVLADADFGRRWRGRDDFLLVSAVEGGVPPRRNRARVVELITVGLIVVSGLGILDLLKTSLLAALACLVVGAITPGEARRAINFDIIVLIAASFGLGAAMQTSGLAQDLGRLLVDAGSPIGDIGILAAVLLATMILTELLSNNAAAVLMFPIAAATATGAGLNFRPFAIAILIGASCSFLTPIGYQTNLLVFGMGGYRFRDFTRLGAPLTIITVIVSLIAIPIVFPLQ